MRVAVEWGVFYLRDVAVDHRPQTIDHRRQTIDHRPWTIDHSTLQDREIDGDVGFMGIAPPAFGFAYF